MSGISKSLFMVPFTNISSILVQHNLNMEFIHVRVSIGGDSRKDLISSIIVDPVAPTMAFTIVLKSLQTGIVQVIDSDTMSVDSKPLTAAPLFDKIVQVAATNPASNPFPAEAFNAVIDIYSSSIPHVDAVKYENYRYTLVNTTINTWNKVNFSSLVFSSPSFSVNGSDIIISNSGKYKVYFQVDLSIQKIHGVVDFQSALLVNGVVLPISYNEARLFKETRDSHKVLFNGFIDVVANDSISVGLLFKEFHRHFDLHICRGSILIERYQ